MASLINSNRLCNRAAPCRTRRNVRLVVRATQSGYQSGSQALSQSQPTTGRAKVLQLLGEGLGLYNGAEQFEPAVKQLILENPTVAPGSFAVQLGQGTWQVFHAPHISKMSSALSTRFSPIQYRLTGTALVSNVKYSSPLGDGWLSAGGTMARKYDDAVEVTFDRFWVDLGADSLRADLPADAAKQLFTPDGVVGALGRAAFFPQLAVFPVLYLDSDLAVFKFTPLDSAIACHRVA